MLRVLDAIRHCRLNQGGYREREVILAPMPLSDWFSELKPSDVPEHLSSFIEDFVKMLDEHRPTKLVPERSYLRRSDGGVELRLAHADEDEADILIHVADDEATVVWASTHEHAWPHESPPEDNRPWTSLVVDLVASILRARKSSSRRSFAVIHG